MIINVTNYERGLKKSIAKALNNTAYQMKAVFIKTIQKKYGLTVQGAILIANTKMLVTKATETNLKVVLKPTSRMIPLTLFNAEQNRSMPGTSVEIYRGKPQMLPQTFIPANKAGERYTLPKSGLPGVFKRIGGSTPQKIALQGGFPFRQMFMESIPEADKLKNPILEKNIQIQVVKAQKS